MNRYYTFIGIYTLIDIYSYLLNAMSAYANETYSLKYIKIPPCIFFIFSIPSCWSSSFYS